MINLDRYPNPYMHPEYKVSHDWCLWLDISLVGEIYYIHKRLGTLNLHEGSVITDTHQRRSESRQVIRDRKYLIEKSEYRKIMAYYYLAEIYDMLPKMLQRLIRKYIQWK